MIEVNEKLMRMREIKERVEIKEKWRKEESKWKWERMVKLKLNENDKSVMNV